MWYNQSCPTGTEIPVFCGTGTVSKYCTDTDIFFEQTVLYRYENTGIFAV